MILEHSKFNVTKAIKTQTLVEERYCTKPSKRDVCRSLKSPISWQNEETKSPVRKEDKNLPF